MIIPKNKESEMAVPSYIQYLPQSKQAQAIKDFRGVIEKLFPTMPTEYAIEQFADYTTGIVNYEGKMVACTVKDKDGKQHKLHENEDEYRYQLTLKLSDETTIELIREHSQDPDAEHIIYEANHAYITCYGETYAIELNPNNIENVIKLATKLDSINKSLDNMTMRAARLSHSYAQKQTISKALNAIENGIDVDFAKIPHSSMLLFSTQTEKLPHKAYALSKALVAQDVIPALPKNKSYTKNPEKFMDKLPSLIEKYSEVKAEKQAEQNAKDFDLQQ